MALATVEHHSYGPTANDALRGQRTVTRAGEGEVREEHQALRGQTRLHPRTRPAPLVEVQPQGVWCSTVASSSSCRLSMSLCCRWWNSQWMCALSFAFPFLRLPSRLSKCPSLPFLVVLFSARLCLSRSWWNSWWKCRLCCPITCSSSGLPSRSSIFRFRVVEEVLVEVFKASPRDRAQQRFLVQITSTLLFLTLVEEVLWEVFKASPKDRAQQRFVEQNMSSLLFLTVVEEVLVEVFKASPRDRAHQRFVEQKTSTLQFLMVVLEREIFTVFPEDRVPQRLLLSRPSVLIVEVLKVFLVDRVPQRLPSSRLFLRLLIDRCHKPRFMAVMTSGCA